MTNGQPPSAPPLIWSRGCTWSLVAWPVLAAAAYFYLDPGLGKARLWLAIAAGLMAVISLGGLFNLLFKHPETREDAVARGQLKEELKEGDTVVISGRVTALNPLTSPLTETPCVAYFYRFWREVLTSTGHRGREPVYWGCASQPFNVDTGVTTFHVDAVPELSIPPARLDGPDIVERARKFLATTSPTIVGEGAAGVFRVAAYGSSALTLFREILTHDSGDARHDWKLAKDFDLSILHYEEEVVPVGGTVAVSGRWSSARNALVARSGDAAATPVTVSIGSRTVNQGGPSSLVGMWVSTLLLTALLAVLLWFGHDITRFTRMVR